MLCRSLAESLPITINADSYGSPHTKTHLLLQAHFSSALLPIADYVTDTKSVLDQALRILQVSYCILATKFVYSVKLYEYSTYVTYVLAPLCICIYINACTE